jgi:holin-like protein
VKPNGIFFWDMPFFYVKSTSQRQCDALLIVIGCAPVRCRRQQPIYCLNHVSAVRYLIFKIWVIKIDLCDSHKEDNMKYLMQLGILLAFWIVGEWISSLFAGIIVIPGAIMGMLLLFFALSTGILKESHIKETSDFFLNNIAFFFIPASIGVLAVADALKGSAIKLFAITIVSTFVTMVVTMVVTQILTSARSKK